MFVYIFKNVNVAQCVRCFVGDPVYVPVSFFLSVCVYVCVDPLDGFIRVRFILFSVFLFWHLSKPKIKPTNRNQKRDKTK